MAGEEELAAHIDPTVRAAPELVARIEDALEGRVGLPIAYDSCFRAIHWAALLDVRGPLIFDDLFEPLIVLFERGGGFGTENRSADFALAMMGMWQAATGRLAGRAVRGGRDTGGSAVVGFEPDLATSGPRA
jgi:hypothetical protein